MEKIEATAATPPPPGTVPGSMGSAAAEFKVTRGRILLGTGLGILLGVAGCGFLAGVLESGSNRLWGLLGLALLLTGGCVLILMKLIASLRLWVSPQGYVVATLGKGRVGRCFRIQSLEPAREVPTLASRAANRATACWNRGLIYSAQGDYENALTELNEAIRLDPGLTVAYHARAAVHAYRGDYAKALADYAAARPVEVPVKAG
jgi:tetratricopeptide (TPR) repeat protein